MVMPLGIKVGDGKRNRLLASGFRRARRCARFFVG
jgi:hypothetical protein